MWYKWYHGKTVLMVVFFTCRGPTLETVEPDVNIIVFVCGSQIHLHKFDAITTILKG